eukprot:6904194-Alexandrium_andersonii.AAC.1
MDTTIGLPSKGKNDERERRTLPRMRVPPTLLACTSVRVMHTHLCAIRTLLQPAKLLFPMDEDQSKKAYQFWKGVQAFSRPLLEEAELMATRDMLVPEDLSDVSLPSTSDITTHINPPEKHQQFGVDAARKAL